jgi:hypothetical protein
LIADFENNLDVGEAQDARVDELRIRIREAVATLTIALKDES